MEQEHWINEILASTEGMTPAIPDKALFSIIQERIEAQRKVQPQWMWLAAAGILLLILLNIKLLSQTTNTDEKSAEVIVSSICKSNQLY